MHIAHVTNLVWGAAEVSAGKNIANTAKLFILYILTRCLFEIPAAC